MIEYNIMGIAMVNKQDNSLGHICGILQVRILFSSFTG